MNPYQLFQKGEIVQVINANSSLYGKVGKIDFITISCRYLVKFQEGNYASLFPKDISPYLGYK
jgi:hypothetical protein